MSVEDSDEIVSGFREYFREVDNLIEIRIVLPILQIYLSKISETE